MVRCFNDVWVTISPEGISFQAGNHCRSQGWWMGRNEENFTLQEASMALWNLIIDTVWSLSIWFSVTKVYGFYQQI